MIMLETWCYIISQILLHLLYMDNSMYYFMWKRPENYLKAIFPKNKQDQNICAGPNPHVKPAKSVESTLLLTKP